MKAFINIENDQELRDHVKQLMLGQIKSIARKEINEVIREEIRSKIIEGNISWFRDAVKRAMVDAIEHILRKDYNVSGWTTEFIEPIVSKKVTSAIQGKDWDSIVNRVATDKLKSMLK